MKNTPVNAANLSGLLAKARSAGSVRLTGNTQEERRQQFMQEVLEMDDSQLVKGINHGQKRKNFVR
ncbi:hypothetical protein [Siccibacter colletis]|uniref:hypothetical protein n=1 Tax=Siccibacter colletis TaxID=1505757 RepID=UPI0004E152C3|nr:hypothetical protein [Siccibacter colletis]